MKEITTERIAAIISDAKKKGISSDKILELIHMAITDYVPNAPVDKEVELSKDLMKEITEILQRIGVPAHIKGYHYLRDAIEYAVRNPKWIHEVTKKLYPYIARENETTSARVERAIRHAIEVAWNRRDETVLNNYFGYTIHCKPTNSEFIALISDKIRVSHGLT